MVVIQNMLIFNQWFLGNVWDDKAATSIWAHTKTMLHPFFLKDNSKKWLYNMPTDSITSWNEVVTVLLKKYYPTW